MDGDGSRPLSKGGRGSRPATQEDSRPVSRAEGALASKKERKPSVTGFWEREASGIGEDMATARAFRQATATALVCISRMLAAAKQIADIADALVSEIPEKDPKLAKRLCQVTASTLNLQDQAGRHLFGGVRTNQTPFLEFRGEEYSGAVAWELGRLERHLTTAEDFCHRIDKMSFTPMQLGFLRDDLYGTHRVQVGPHTTLTYGVRADDLGFQHVLAGAQILQGLKRSDPDRIRTSAKSLLSKGIAMLREHTIITLQENLEEFKSAESAAQGIRLTALKEVALEPERPRTPSSPGGLLTYNKEEWIPGSPVRRPLRPTKSAAELSMRAKKPQRLDMRVVDVTSHTLKECPKGPWPFPLRTFGGRNEL